VPNTCAEIAACVAILREASEARRAARRRSGAHHRDPSARFGRKICPESNRGHGSRVLVKTSFAGGENYGEKNTMDSRNISQVGKYNMQLIADIFYGQETSMGFPIQATREEGGWRHPQLFNYDLNYGISAVGSRNLEGGLVGVKYYCTKDGKKYDLAKRIVHIHHPGNKLIRSLFYLLIHAKSEPTLSDNSYSECWSIKYSESDLFPFFRSVGFLQSALRRSASHANPVGAASRARREVDGPE
jgi:hypothetical protein